MRPFLRVVRPFLRVMFALHNFQSMVKDTLNRRELPLMDIGRLYNEQYPCNCFLCQIIHNTGVWEYTTTESVTFLPIHRAPTEEDASYVADSINSGEDFSASSDGDSDDSSGGEPSDREA